MFFCFWVIPFEVKEISKNYILLEITYDENHFQYLTVRIRMDVFVFYVGEEKHKYGQQRMWGAIGWGTMSIVSGVCVDWFSKGEDKNYTPGFIMTLICIVLDIYVLSKIKVSRCQLKTLFINCSIMNKH